MSRDQRVHDNHALLFAFEKARELNMQVSIVFILQPTYPAANMRHFTFMLEGLKETEIECNKLNIPFKMLTGNPVDVLPAFILESNVAMLITDFDPIKIKQQWKSELINKLAIPFYEVDAHNIVPCWHASDKQEYGAYTIRPKIKKQLNTYLNKYLPLKKQSRQVIYKNKWENIYNSLKTTDNVAPVTWLKPGYQAGMNMLAGFISNKINNYQTKRNNPCNDFTSHLSPYIHFGQISAQHIALEVIKHQQNTESSSAFLEELIIRRELSDNFCYYNANYDNIKGAPNWAIKTLAIHENDTREFLYTIQQFEQGITHDKLWNAAQHQLIRQGKMHGYMRMYWAKKILEWTISAEQALQISIYLNDKYSLDGRDPNGYTGCLWSVAGLHDRPWTERPVFGKIRYMNYNGCKRKFDVLKYIETNFSDNLF